MRVHRPIASILCTGWVLAATALSAAEHHNIGQTFPISEPDVLDEIKQRAAARDWQSLLRRHDPTTFSGFHSASLPPAEADASFLFDPTYTLPRNVTDAKGQVIYPAGTTINVYERRTFPGRTIVVLPTVAHFRWLRDVAKPTHQDKVLISGGSVLDARRAFQDVRLYALDKRVIERFGLRAVPTIVQQEGIQLRVTEYLVPLDDHAGPAAKLVHQQVESSDE